MNSRILVANMPAGFMYQTIRKYKSVLRFILTFLGSYLLLSFLYAQYLNYGASQELYPDPITHYVAAQSEWFIELFGYTASIEPHTQEPSMKLSVENVYLARVVEGCNGISVMILFTAFILAFYNTFLKTFFFTVCGIGAIYFINVVRIALLAIAIYEYPTYNEVLHGVIFPAVIYGFVFLLWILWVNRFKVNNS